MPNVVETRYAIITYMGDKPIFFTGYMLGASVAEFADEEHAAYYETYGSAALVMAEVERHCEGHRLYIKKMHVTKH